MALLTCTITGDLSDHVGVDFDTRRAKLYAVTNIDGDTIAYGDSNVTRLGAGKVTLNADGTFTAVVPRPGGGSNPASWQTSLVFDYPGPLRALDG